MVRDMKNRRRFSGLRQRSALAAGVIALAAAVAMGGLYYSRNREKEDDGHVIQTVRENQQEKSEQETEDQEQETVETSAGTKETGSSNNMEAESQAQEMARKELEESSQENIVKKSDEKKLSFSSDTKISWPVEGNVLMNYSMDQTVYSATLDQYCFHPAIVIQADVNDKVQAAADCQVTDLSTNEETGLTLTADLGTGYTVVYGQLKEVSWEKGDIIREGETVGYIAEPTKYYSVEGSSLYFAMKKDGKPVNPMDYLK